MCSSVQRSAARERHFLFLQGIPGPFFRRLASRLQVQGCRVSRVNLNGGDLFDWLGRGTNYRGASAHWPEWLTKTVLRREATDIVVFGDCRPMHRMARAVAADLSIRFWVFEEGYLRPDHVTLEENGVNGFSGLPRTLAELREMEPELDSGTAVPIDNRFGRRARSTFLHYVALCLARPLFPGYRSHRIASPVREGWGWFRRWLRRRREHEESEVALRRMGTSPFFLFPLQLDGDSQLQFHSPFDNMESAVAVVLDSFARWAPPSAALLVKLHPLDPDLQNARSAVVRLAERASIGSRVFFIEHGDLSPLLTQAQGVVTVNSTVGPLALAKGRPVHVLGSAVYAIDGLVSTGSLDQFWDAPSPPAPGSFDLFRRVLVDRALLNGGFYSESGLDLLVRLSARRLRGV